ncbi:efflux RND transporter periplasmic adaptor subunit [Chloroflexota bacterium]
MIFHRKSFWIVALLALLGAAGSGTYYYTTIYQPAQASQKADTLQTTQVRQGDLSISASGAGKLVPAQEAAIGFGSSGVLIELNVEPGDVVQAGQVLARLDDGEAQTQLAQAETNLRLAQAKLDEVQTTITQAEINLSLAELKIKTLQEPPDPEAVAVAEANLTSTQADLSTLLDGSDLSELTIAAADWEQAAVDLKQAQAAYDEVAWGDEAGMSSQAATLQSATLAYQKAQAIFEQKTAGATEAEIIAAKVKILQAQQQVNDLLAEPDANDLAATQLAGEQARANLSAAHNTTNLNIAVEQAQLNIDTARRNLAELTLKAPFAGTVLEVNAAVGETVGPTPFITLADMSRPLLEIYLDETEMDKLAVGNNVEVEFESIPDVFFTGQVMRVNPMVILVDDAPAVSALAELTGIAGNPPGPLPQLLVGMNASVDIMAGEADDVLLVPVESLRELGPGSYAVFVLEEGQPKLRPVEVGLMDLTYAEIVNGLNKGETITTGIIDTE